MRAEIIGTLLTLLAFGFQHRAAGAASPSAAADQALRFFAAIPATPAVILERLRPAPIDAAAKHRALAVLPTEGELRPTPEERVKLAGLKRLLTYHQRGQVFEVRVVDLPQAGIVLDARVFVLITRPALRMVSADELQAMVAHEVGHDFFWTEYERARDSGDAAARSELELRCDAIAVLTLLELDLDPGLLISAARKLTRFNERLGTAADTGHYPSVAEREWFTRAVVAAYGRSAPARERHRY